LNERDLGMMRSLANLVAYRLEEQLESTRGHEEAATRMRRALDQGQPAMVYQPIYRLEDGGIEGVECLARFELEPRRPPNEWFEEAAAIGMGMSLESAACQRALHELESLAGDFVMAINCSPQAIVGGPLSPSLRGVNAQRIVLEITEHSSVDDYAELRRSLVPLRAAGARIAIDDAGAGYASMRHFLTIDPEIIKLDISLTRNIHRDRRRRALAGAMLEFARHSGSTLVAQGVESFEELDTLRELGVREAQGYHLCRPRPLARRGELLARTRTRSGTDGRPM
jgi:EAL domain-containing protein (putative c-di-GMP-specific phosphodiesterase class I)